MQHKSWSQLLNHRRLEQCALQGVPAPDASHRWLSHREIVELANDCFLDQLRHMPNGSEDKWSLMELVAKSAFLVEPNTEADHRLGKSLLADLQRQFGVASVRVQCLQALPLERSDPGEALRVYLAILGKEESHLLAWKRKTALILAQSQTRPNESVQALLELLEHFSCDTEAWECLAKLYWDGKQLEQAAYCLEELMVLRPQTPEYAVRYAEVLMEMGGHDQWVIARKYFCLALESNVEDELALRGLEKCLKQLEQTEARRRAPTSVSAGALSELRSLLRIESAVASS